MREQLRPFLVAVAYFSRLPIPAWVGYRADDLNRAAPWFPLVGLIIGALVAALYSVTALVLPLRVALVLALCGSVLLTGGFHEDGLADASDGLGGGWERADVLRIMQDSRIGSFGALALILSFMLRLETLAALPLALLPWLLVAVHGCSRWLAISLMLSLDYVREEGKAKPLATGLRWPAFAVSGVAGILPLLLCGPVPALLALSCALFLRGYIVWRLQRRIGGYTGDTLGMAQQLFELTLLLAFLAWLSI